MQGSPEGICCWLERTSPARDPLTGSLERELTRVVLQIPDLQLRGSLMALSCCPHVRTLCKVCRLRQGKHALLQSFLLALEQHRVLRVLKLLRQVLHAQ